MCTMLSKIRYLITKTKCFTINTKISTKLSDTYKLEIDLWWVMFRWGRLQSRLLLMSVASLSRGWDFSSYMFVKRFSVDCKSHRTYNITKQLSPYTNTTTTTTHPCPPRRTFTTDHYKYNRKHKKKSNLYHASHWRKKIDETRKLEQNKPKVTTLGPT